MATLPFKVENFEIKVDATAPLTAEQSTLATEVTDELKTVTGKFQNAALALLLLGLPGNIWDEFAVPATAATKKSLREKLTSFGFSPDFIDDLLMNKLDQIVLAKPELDAVRASLFGATDVLGNGGVIPLYDYDGGGGCQQQKLLAMVLQARAQENAMRTFILQAKKL